MDPHEGLDASGHITTGVDDGELAAPYDQLVAQCRDAIRAVLGSELHSLYVYGSVATRQAVPPRSDLDLYAVVRNAAAAQRCGDIATSLSARHRDVVRDIGIARSTLSQLHADNDAGVAERCFLRHYCRFVTGSDLRPGLPACAPGPALVREFIGDLGAAVSGFREQLAAGTVCAGPVARRLLRSAAVLFSTDSGEWSTAREVGAELISARNPRYADVSRTLLAWAQLPVPATGVAPAQVRGVLDGLGAWLVAQAEELVPGDADATYGSAPTPGAKP